MINEAISLYEANLQDKFYGPHPYERLRIIYTIRKDYDNATRVCQAFIEVDSEGLLNEPTSEKVVRFQEHIEKLQQRYD